MKIERKLLCLPEFHNTINMAQTTHKASPGMLRYCVRRSFTVSAGARLERRSIERKFLTFDFDY